MSNETIKFLMPNEDADVLQKLFDQDTEPDFTIIRRFDILDTSVSSVEIVAQSSLTVWFLIKRVESEQEFDRRLKRIQEEATAKISAKHEEIIAKIKANRDGQY